MSGFLALALIVGQAASLEVQVQGPAGTLAGTLTLPQQGRAPFPAVVTLTGSGAHYRDGNPSRPPASASTHRLFRESASPT